MREKMLGAWKYNKQTRVLDDRIMIRSLGVDGVEESGRVKEVRRIFSGPAVVVRPRRFRETCVVCQNIETGARAQFFELVIRAWVGGTISNTQTCTLWRIAPSPLEGIWGLTESSRTC